MIHMFKRVLVYKNVHITVLYGDCFTVVLVAQWIKRLPGVREVVGSIPVGDSDFFLCPTFVSR